MIIFICSVKIYVKFTFLCTIVLFGSFFLLLDKMLGCPAFNLSLHDWSLSLVCERNIFIQLINVYWGSTMITSLWFSWTTWHRKGVMMMIDMAWPTGTKLSETPYTMLEVIRLSLDQEFIHSLGLQNCPLPWMSIWHTWL